MKNKTPKPPVVSSDLWQKLYEKAFVYETLQPWKAVNEDRIFAFIDPSSNQIGYCCLLGNCEEFSGLSVYRGREGVEMFFELKRREIDPKGIDVLHKHNALVVEFTKDKKMLDKEDLAVIKSLTGLKKNPKSFPCFRSYLPGFRGWFLTEEEVRFFTLALECSTLYAAKQSQITSFDMRESMQCPLYIPRFIENEIEWDVTEHTLSPLPKKKPLPVRIDPGKIGSLKETKLCHDGAWEVSIINTPNVVCDRGRPYLAKICLIVHQDTLLVLHVNPIPPDCNYSEFLAEEILCAIKKHKRLPGELLFNDALLQESLRPLTKALGIQGTLTDVLTATVPAKESLLQYME